MIKILKIYFMHILGVIGFASIVLLGVLEFFKSSDKFYMLLPYGTVLIIFNIIYIKLILLSREDYEKKLKEEKEYSQELVKSQKIFLRHAVHETNTPLAVIMANIELFELEFGKHPVLSNINAATKNLYSIYDDLSYLASRDKIRYKKQKILFGDFIQSRVEFFDVVAKQSSISFEFENLCENSTVLINSTKLQRIVDNNITNAIKYTKKYEVVKITLYYNEECCIFEISSNSTIIENPEHIFNEYYRENRVEDGFGVGLNLVKNICDAEDIKIVLDSSPEKTSFKYLFKNEIK